MSSILFWLSILGAYRMSPEMQYFISAVWLAIAAWIFIDAMNRRWGLSKALAYVTIPFLPLIFAPTPFRLLTLLVPFFIVPNYIARRPLKFWEIRVGGRQWNIWRNLAVSLTILLIFGVSLFFATKEFIAPSFNVPRAEIDAMMGPAQFAWMAVLNTGAILFSLTVALKYRNLAVVERGPTFIIPPAGGQSHDRLDRYVERRDDCYRIVGSRVSLDSVVYAFREGLSPQSIAADCFPTLTAKQVVGALRYYLAHRDEVDAHLAREREAYEVQRLLQRQQDPEFYEKFRKAREQITQPS